MKRIFQTTHGLPEGIFNIVAHHVKFEDGCSPFY